MGNHDWNAYSVNDAGTTRYKWDNETSYAQIIKQCEDYVHMGDDLCYYYDVEACKTRYIFLNSYGEDNTRGMIGEIPAAQIEWFNGVLDGTPGGYRIVVVMHIWFDPYNEEVSTQGTQISTICDAFNEDHDDKKVMFMLGGHVHYDYKFATDGGIPIVLTDTDSYRSVPSGVTASIDTVNEQCFDVITLDYTNNKVKCVRIGRGSDRTYDLYSES